jgi:hypothetical protein
MREYSNKISLTKNSRGIYSLDTIIGCNSGMANEIGGCYNDCYAAKSAKLYGYDFSKNVNRYFESEKQRLSIVKAINKIPLPFVRIGTSGDPSEDWQHTINILEGIKTCNKEIVIITRHWQNLTDIQLEKIQSLNVCINTSISALDNENVLNNCLAQYNRIKPFCKSILRIVSCNFNLENSTGHKLFKIQKELFENESVIDTVLRVNNKNRFVKEGIIKVEKTKFLGKNALVSKYNKSTYFDKCSTCFEMCGVNVKSDNEKKRSNVQLKMFKK